MLGVAVKAVAVHILPDGAQQVFALFGDAAAQGDPAAGKVIDEYVDYLGCGVASLVNIFQPEVICIGGGPSAQGETLMAPVRYILNREDYARNNLHRTRLVRAALGNDAGLIGAALLPLFR